MKGGKEINQKLSQYESETDIEKISEAMHNRASPCKEIKPEV